jgi:hypothetical protein
MVGYLAPIAHDVWLARRWLACPLNRRSLAPELGRSAGPSPAGPTHPVKRGRRVASSGTRRAAVGYVRPPSRSGSRRSSPGSGGRGHRDTCSAPSHRAGSPLPRHNRTCDTMGPARTVADQPDLAEPLATEHMRLSQCLVPAHSAGRTRAADGRPRYLSAPQCRRSGPARAAGTPPARRRS